MLAVNNLVGHNQRRGAPVVTAETIVADLWEYWPLDVVSGDRRGVVNGRNLSEVGAVAAAQGKLGHLAKSSDAGDYLESGVTANSTSWSVAGWWRIQSDSSAGEPELFRFGGSGADYTRLTWESVGSHEFHLKWTDGVEAENDYAWPAGWGVPIAQDDPADFHFLVLVCDEGDLKVWHDSGAGGPTPKPGFLNLVTTSSLEPFVGEPRLLGGAADGIISASCVGIWERALDEQECLYLWNDGDGRKLFRENIFPVAGQAALVAAAGQNWLDTPRAIDGDAVGYPAASTSLDAGKEARGYAPDCWLAWRFPFAVYPTHMNRWTGSQTTAVSSPAAIFEGKHEGGSWENLHGQSYGHQGPHDIVTPALLDDVFPASSLREWWRYRLTLSNEAPGAYASLEEMELFV